MPVFAKKMYLLVLNWQHG